MYLFGLGFAFAFLGPALCSAICPYSEQGNTRAGHSHYKQAVIIEAKTEASGVIYERHLDTILKHPGKKGVMLMNRINPSSIQLYIANSDGSNERLLLGNQSVFEYHASFSPDGQHVAFTSERNGDGNSDLYMINVNGGGLRPIATMAAVEDAVSISPDGKYAVYASTRDVFTSNIWLSDLETGLTRNLTNQTGITGRPDSPSGLFSPSWSPNGQHIVFSSDRNTEWTGHDNGTGWEHTQNLSIYSITPQGTDFRLVYSEPAMSLGSPKFSPDGKRIVFYEMSLQQTFDSRSELKIQSVENQIFSVDFATGTDRRMETNSSGCKIYPQYLSNDNIGYLIKGGPSEGIHYTNSSLNISGKIRSPSWSRDGRYVLYERIGWKTRPLQKKLYSWDEKWEYRFMDTFPELSKDGMLAFTYKQTGSPGNSSVAVMQPSNKTFDIPFDIFEIKPYPIPESIVAGGGAGFFQPSWSSDEDWITFGLGYPSYPPDGKTIVYRVYGREFGLRFLDLETNHTSKLTTERDNLPSFSPDGQWILFTRNVSEETKGQLSNYEICTIRHNGSNYNCLISSAANDAHAVWTPDGRVIWSSGMWGFQAKAATYDDSFQPYGQIMIMDADGLNKTVLTNSIWEDSMPVYVSNSDYCSFAGQ